MTAAEIIARRAAIEQAKKSLDASAPSDIAYLGNHGNYPTVMLCPAAGQHSADSLLINSTTRLSMQEACRLRDVLLEWFPKQPTP